MITIILYPAQSLWTEEALSYYKFLFKIVHVLTTLRLRFQKLRQGGKYLFFPLNSSAQRISLLNNLLTRYKQKMGLKGNKQNLLVAQMAAWGGMERLLMARRRTQTTLRARRLRHNRPYAPMKEMESEAKNCWQPLAIPDPQFRPPPSQQLLQAVSLSPTSD